MTPKEKAEELVNKFKEFVNGYVGSSMLTNTEYYEIILLNAKQCAIIAVDEILEIEYWQYMESGGKQEQIYWQEVKQEIKKL